MAASFFCVFTYICANPVLLRVQTQQQEYKIVDLKYKNVEVFLTGLFMTYKCVGMCVQIRRGDVACSTGITYKIGDITYKHVDCNNMKLQSKYKNVALKYIIVDIKYRFVESSRGREYLKYKFVEDIFSGEKCRSKSGRSGKSAFLEKNHQYIDKTVAILTHVV